MAKKRAQRKPARSSKTKKAAVKAAPSPEVEVRQVRRLIEHDQDQRNPFEHGVYLHNNVFVISSIIGFVISAFWVYPMSKPWGFAFGLLCVIMFISSVISMTFAPIGVPDDDLHIDPRRKKG